MKSFKKILLVIVVVFIGSVLFIHFNNVVTNNKALAAEKLALEQVELEEQKYRYPKPMCESFEEYIQSFRGKSFAYLQKSLDEIGYEQDGYTLKVDYYEKTIKTDVDENGIILDIVVKEY